MKEAAIGRQQSVIAPREPAEVGEPSERALHDPAAPIAAEATAVFVRGLSIVPAA